jgi:DNA-binding transcriptional MerR regulator
MLTIGQLASFAGVTVRAVRHYHERGLLPEPERDSSGYRRYDGQAVVTLIRIKTLAEAGVPLSRVSELLQADPGKFGQAIVEIDRDLQARVELLQEHRRRVARLANGDELALPDEVVAYLARLREIGVSERVIGIEHDGWIVLAAYAPDRVAEWIRLKYDALDDRRYRDIYLRFGEAFDWNPDDPRLSKLADTMVDYLRRVPAAREPAATNTAAFDDTIVALVDTQTTQASPSWKRLQMLVESRVLDMEDP